MGDILPTLQGLEEISSSFEASKVKRRVLAQMDKTSTAIVDIVWNAWQESLAFRCQVTCIYNQKKHVIRYDII